MGQKTGNYPEEPTSTTVFRERKTRLTLSTAVVPSGNCLVTERNSIITNTDSSALSPLEPHERDALVHQPMGVTDLRAPLQRAVNEDRP